MYWYQDDVDNIVPLFFDGQIVFTTQSEPVLPVKACYATQVVLYAHDVL